MKEERRSAFTNEKTLYDPVDPQGQPLGFEEYFKENPHSFTTEYREPIEYMGKMRDPAAVGFYKRYLENYGKPVKQEPNRQTVFKKMQDERDAFEKSPVFVKGRETIERLKKQAIQELGRTPTNQEEGRKFNEIYDRLTKDNPDIKALQDAAKAFEEKQRFSYANMGMQDPMSALTSSGQQYKPVSRIKDTDKGRIPLDEIDKRVGPPEDFMRPIDDIGDQKEDQPDDDTQEAFQPGPVLKEGTETPEVSEAAKLLDEAQEAYASSTRSLTEIQQAMSGKDPEEIYKNRDYTSVEDGTPQEREAAGTSLSTKILRHVTGLEELTPEDIAKYDVDGDGQITVDDNTQYLRMGTGLQEPNEAFTEFFLNKYPSTPVTYQQALEEAELAQTQVAALVFTQQKAFDIEVVPSTGEALGKAISTPSAILSQPTGTAWKLKMISLLIVKQVR